MRDCVERGRECEVVGLAGRVCDCVEKERDCEAAGAQAETECEASG